MTYLNIIDSFDGGVSELILALGGAVLFIYVIFSRRLLSRKKYGKSIDNNHNIVIEKDILGMDKASAVDYIQTDNVDRGSSIKVKTILLIILVIIGLYLVFSKSNVLRRSALSPTESHLKSVE